ncbi:MAG: tRNA (N6-threonylcarbamoyladenosine(37)-N6)-methyltransferase TrmO [Euryarchaeota archaeon]|nr:tRNA (N6-threonylcarbamoyladenosine(37)-N6)-methyltransferase TrmO [Euryarchaeota archaeon]
MMELKKIGEIHSPYKTNGDAPRQGRLKDTPVEIIIANEYLPGLKDLEHCTHIFVLYWLDRADRNLLSATPPGMTSPKGVFATRSPHRPNPIGLGIADLVKIEGNILHVKGLDALDRTPVLDIKPYAKGIDCIPNAKDGIFDNLKNVKPD